MFVQNHTPSSWPTCAPQYEIQVQFRYWHFARDAPLFFALWRQWGHCSSVQWRDVTRLAAVHALALSFGYEPECDAWRALHYLLFSHKIIARLRVFQVLNHDNNHQNTGSVFTNDLTTRSTRFCRYLYFPGTDWKPAYKIMPKLHADLSRAMNYKPLNKYNETFSYMK